MAEGSQERIKQEPRESSIKQEVGAPPPLTLLAGPSRSTAPSRTSQASSPRRSTRGDVVEDKDGDQEKEKRRKGRSSSGRREARHRSRQRSGKREFQARRQLRSGIQHRPGWQIRYDEVCAQRDKCMLTINATKKYENRKETWIVCSRHLKTCRKTSKLEGEPRNSWGDDRALQRKHR